MVAELLSTQLMRERELLELLLFKLEEQQLLIASGRTRWIQHAAKEVERVMQAMPMEALARDTLVVSVATEWGAPEAITLRGLIEHAPSDAWREVFEGHFQAMTALAEEIRMMKQINEQRLRVALRVTQETIAGLGDPTGEYDLSGDVVRSGGSRLLDTEV